MNKYLNLFLKSFLLCIALSVVVQVYAQEETVVVGKVTDEALVGIQGVSVRAKGTSVSTISDQRGNFRLKLKGNSVALVFSSVGYESREVTYKDSNPLNVALKSANNALEEVVVMGYGTVAKSDLTGAVSSFDNKDATKRPVSSIEQMLQGQVSGVQITQSTGGTASGFTFNIRGVTSISGSNQPLVVIDGYPVDTDNGDTKMAAGSQSNYLGVMPEDNALASLNPSDVESVEILKDASATAIYGSRGANGVVLITTKRGKAGRDKIEYTFRQDISQLAKKIDVLGTRDYINYRNEGYINTTGLPDSDYDTQEKIDAASATNTNWQDLIFRTANSQNHQLNTSGGNDKMKYALSLGYYGENGIIKNSHYDRGSLRLNLDREVNKNLKIGANISGTIGNNKAAKQSSDRDDASQSIITGALKTRPTLAPWTADDDIDFTVTGNPLTLINEIDDQNKVTNLMSNLFAEYSIINGLTAKISGGINNTISHRDMYWGYDVAPTLGGYAYEGDINAFNYSTVYTLNFNRTINRNHRINAVLGYQWQDWKKRFQAVNAQNFPNDKTSYNNLGAAGTFPAPVSGRNESALSSYFGRAVYSYAGKYLATLTGRMDGSTRLSDGNKWHFFPALALGWNVHKESFLLHDKAISELKLRASYGLSGNQSIAIGATKSSLATTTATINQAVSTGYYPGNIPDDNLTWETTRQLNLGTDMAFFNNRLTFTFDYYRKKTEDLLIALYIPPSNGFTVYNTNNGSIENTGYEFDLGVRPVSGSFNWMINGNLSINRNKVISLGDLNEILGNTFLAVSGQSLHIAKVGYPVGSFYGYKTQGIYQTPEEVAEDNAKSTDSAPREPGLIKYKDTNNDGVIDANDREIIGNPYPSFIFGLTNSFDWKNFSLSILFQGSIGQDVIDAPRNYLDAMSVGYSGAPNVRTEAYDNRWTGPGTSNKYPKPTQRSEAFNSRFTDIIVEDASYVRLKNVTLSYQFPARKLPLVQTIGIFATGSNLLTFTNYKGYDPEIDSRAGKGMMPGVDSGSIPQYRSFAFGVNVGF